MVVVKFFVFVSEVVSIFSKILTWIFGGQKDSFAPNSIIGGRAPRLPPKSTPMKPIDGWTGKRPADDRYSVSWTPTTSWRVFVGNDRFEIGRYSWKAHRGEALVTLGEV